MVKRLKSISEKKASPAAGLLDSHLAGMVKDSAQQIWLAGMGAFAKAQEEGGKVFEALVREGTTLQKKTQGMAEEKISEVTGKMSSMAGDVTNKAGQSWDKLEAIFEQRTAKAMNKLGVPTAKDVDALVKRVDDLAAAVARLSKADRSSSATPSAKGSARSAGKSAVKKAAGTPAKTAAKTVAKTAARRAPVRKSATI